MFVSFLIFYKPRRKKLPLRRACFKTWRQNLNNNFTPGAGAERKRAGSATLTAWADLHSSSSSFTAQHVQVLGSVGPHCPENNLNSHIKTQALSQMERMRGYFLSSTEATHLPLLLWQAQFFLCGDSDNFWDSVVDQTCSPATMVGHGFWANAGHLCPLAWLCLDLEANCIYFCSLKLLCSTFFCRVLYLKMKV